MTGSSSTGAMFHFGTTQTNSEGVRVTPVEAQGVQFLSVDYGDRLPLTIGLCEALGLPRGSVESSQCSILAIIASLLGPAPKGGDSALLGARPREEIEAFAVSLRQGMLQSAQWWRETLGEPQFPISTAEGEIWLYAHDAEEPHHDADLYAPLVLAHGLLTGRSLFTLRTTSAREALLQILEGPSGDRNKTGIAEGGLLLHDQHFTALLSDATAPKSSFADLARAMTLAGALLPALATLPPKLVLERLDGGQQQRHLALKDLIPCPFCATAKRKGLRADVPRVRLPLGIGSELGAWAAELATDGGVASEPGGGAPPVGVTFGNDRPA